jgi:hypothetical protein
VLLPSDFLLSYMALSGLCYGLSLTVNADTIPGTLNILDLVTAAIIA